MRLYLPIIPNIQRCRTNRKNTDGKQNTELNFYRDNLQIEDKDNIQKVLNTLIPEYQAEQKNQIAKKN